MSDDVFDLDEWTKEQGMKQGDKWVPFTGDYRKEFCDIRLKNGTETGPCWPNAGKFVALADGEKIIPGNQVTHLRYYVEAPDQRSDEDEDEDDDDVD
jgi:hypothetical protein